MFYFLNKILFKLIPVLDNEVEMACSRKQLSP